MAQHTMRWSDTCTRCNRNRHETAHPTQCTDTTNHNFQPRDKEPTRIDAQLSDDDDNACADCFHALDEHCENCGECYCENDECLDEDEDEDEDA